jgi:hypothetical protein
MVIPENLMPNETQFRSVADGLKISRIRESVELTAIGWTSFNGKTTRRDARWKAASNTGRGYVIPWNVKQGKNESDSIGRRFQSHDRHRPTV